MITYKESDWTLYVAFPAWVASFVILLFLARRKGEHYSEYTLYLVLAFAPIVLVCKMIVSLFKLVNRCFKELTDSLL